MPATSQEGVLQFLWTSDPAAQAVIVLLWVVAAAWLLVLLREAARHFREQSALRSLRDVGSLVGARQREDDPSLARRDRLFQLFLDRTGVDAGRQTARHVKSIFDAGWSDTRLNVSELNRHTSEQLFSRNTLLKSVLGIFIVIGLFGTLLGLSKSLVPLSAHDLTTATAAEIGPELKSLLRNLKSAFAPSLWGVFLTFVGVLLFSAYLNGVCIPLRAALKRTTLDVWVPALYPTTSQRVLRENLKSAEKVTRAAEKMSDEAEAFVPKVTEANKKLGTFDATLGDAQEVAQQLTQAMKGFAAFQPTLEDTVGKIARHAEATQALFVTISRQNEKLTDGLSALRQFEKKHGERQRRQDEALSETIEAAQQAFEALSERNEEVFRTVGQPLTEELRSIQQTLAERLEHVETRLEQLEDPLQRSAARIEGVAESYPERTERLLRKVREEVVNELGEPVEEGLTNVNDSLVEGLGEVRSGVRRLEDPMERSASKIEGIADSFSKSTERLLRKVQQEFERKNDASTNERKQVGELSNSLSKIARVAEEMNRNGHSGSPHNGDERSWWQRIRWY